MLADDKQMRGLRLPNTLELPPSHTAAAVGHFLKNLYETILSEDQPSHLMSLIKRLEAAERASIRASRH